MGGSTSATILKSATILNGVKRSPFALRDILKAEALTNAASHYQEVIDVSQGNPCGYAHQPTREAFAELMALASARGAGGTETKVPNPKGELWRVVRILAKSTGRSKRDILEELTEMAFGSHYPYQPQPSLVEEGVRAYVHLEHYQGVGDPRELRVVLTAGASAASFLVLRTLQNSAVLGDNGKVAVACPIYSPLVELVKVNGLRVREVFDVVKGTRLSKECRDALLDPDVKLFLVANPNNPTGLVLPHEVLTELSHVVRLRKDLFIVEDGAYDPFVFRMHSLASSIPERTVLVGSFSKIAALCGIRAGYIALPANNLLDTLLKERETPERYRLRIQGEDSFIRRCWLEAGNVSFSHTGSVSIHSMLLAAIFSTLFVHEESIGDAYRKEVNQILKERYESLFHGMEMTPAAHEIPQVCYHAWLDILSLASTRWDSDFATWLESEFSSEGFVRHLAHSHSVMALPGDGFMAKGPLSIRVCVANVPSVEKCYEVGRRIAACLDELKTWHSAGANQCPYCLTPVVSP